MNLLNLILFRSATQEIIQITYIIDMEDDFMLDIIQVWPQPQTLQRLFDCEIFPVHWNEFSNYKRRQTIAY